LLADLRTRFQEIRGFSRWRRHARRNLRGRLNCIVPALGKFGLSRATRGIRLCMDRAEYLETFLALQRERDRPIPGFARDPSESQAVITYAPE